MSDDGDRRDSRDDPASERDALLRLASVAAHQLKSPLSSVQTALDTVIGGFLGPLDPRARDLLEQAAQACRRGTGLVSEVMRLRRLDEFGPDDLSPVDVRPLLVRAVDRVRPPAEQGGLELSWSVPAASSGPWWVLGEPTLVEEALFVPLDNAVRYTPRGGRVEVGLRLTDEESVEVAVSDTGIGIPEEARERVLEEFYRAPNAKRMRRDGTGLGLSFAAAACRLMGGDLALGPAGDGGTRVVLRLPARPDLASEPDAGAAATGEPSRRVVVVGGVTAGSKAAARIMRLDPHADVTVVERGRLLAYAGCGLPYYIAGAVADQRALTSTAAGLVRDPAFFHDLKRVRALEGTEAVAVDRERRTVSVRPTGAGGLRELPYDALVLATGARAALPPAEGVALEGVYTLHGVEDAEAIRSRLRTPSAVDVVLVGAGLLGCEMAESIHARGARLTMVEQADEILGIVDPELAAPVRRHLESHGIRVVTGRRAVRFEGDRRVEAVVLEDGRALPCDFVILATGVQPEVRLARECGLEIGVTGAILVDGRQRTSDPAIWAVGDCAQDHHRVLDAPCWVPSGSSALKQARVAASVICGLDDEFPGELGSWVLKVFDLTASTTGLTEREAVAAGFDPVIALVPGPDRAHFLPTSRPMVLKLVADRHTGRVLGGQAVGEGLVSKRIDVVATALTGGFDVDTLANVELPYAPPYSLGVDPVLAAANIIRNKRVGLLRSVSPADLEGRLRGDAPPLVLDVRMPSEYRDLRMEGSLHVPLGALRGRLDRISREREIVTVCSHGIRSYEAYRVLVERGYERVAILDGGLAAWPYAIERL